MRNLVEKYLKKKKEKVVVSLKVRKYNKTNFDIMLVYNEKIDMHKVLYIPLDIIEENKIDDYMCYQFIDSIVVNYILKTLSNSKDKYKDDVFCNRVNERIDSYGIEINMNFDDESYQFKATQFIPKEWLFLFDVIVVLFEHAPHIVNGYCEDMLTLFKDGAEDIPYQESFEFELLRDDSDKLKKILGGSLLNFEEITYLEEVDGKYFSIISDQIVIINYNKCGVVNTYCDTEDYSDYVYTVIEAIREDVQKKFCRLMVINKDDSSKVQYYLCYGLEEDGLKVIHCCEEKLLPFNLYKDGLIKFIYDEDGMVEEEIRNRI